MTAKVLIGSLVSKHQWYCTKEFLEGLNSIDYENYEIILVENSDTEEFYEYIKNEIKNNTKIKLLRYGCEVKSIREKLVVCRNYLRELFLKGDYEYLLTLDQDVVMPKNGIKKLIEDDKEIITGIVYNNRLENEKIVKYPILFKKYSKETEEWMIRNKEKVKQINTELYNSLEKYKWNFDYVHRLFTPEEVENNKIIEVGYFGNSCVLIKRNVLEKIKFRLEGEFFDDVLFCKDAAKLGFKLYADCSVKCEHYVDKKPWKWNKTEIEYCDKI